MKMKRSSITSTILQGTITVGLISWISLAIFGALLLLVVTGLAERAYAAWTKAPTTMPQATTLQR